MTVKDIYAELGKMILEGYGGIELECSVDMSVEGNEDTYMNRIFGKSPYCVRYLIERDIDRTEIKRTAQILFEKGESNYGENI